jgi:hypothetical protein
VVKGLTWDDEILRYGGERAGDNWAITWVAADVPGTGHHLITSYGDGNGFGPRERNYSLAFATVTGAPPQIEAEDLVTDADSLVGWGSDGIKASGLLAVGKVLYLFVRNAVVNGDWRHARLAISSNLGETWTWAAWAFAESFGCPEFVQFGPAYAGARDDYVYVVSQDGNSAYDFNQDVVMARVHKTQVAQREAYTFYAGAGSDGPLWSPDIRARQPIFSDPRGTQRVGLTYNRALGRYFLVTAHEDGSGATHTPALGVFDALEPWGPWSTVYYDDAWAQGWMIHHKFPTAWMSEDGRDMWLVFSGEYRPGGEDYRLLLRRARVEIA